MLSERKRSGYAEVHSRRLLNNKANSCQVGRSRRVPTFVILPASKHIDPAPLKKYNVPVCFP